MRNKTGNRKAMEINVSFSTEVEYEWINGNTFWTCFGGLLNSFDRLQNLGWIRPVERVFSFLFFFFSMLHLCVKPASAASQTQFSTSDSQAAVVSSSRKILVLCILYEDKLILHSLDLICCVSNNFLALFGNNLLPHRPLLFSVQFPDNIHTAGDRNNTDKA